MKPNTLPTADTTPTQHGSCTLEHRCSSTGAVCAVDDRACQNDARTHGLEVSCEVKSPPGFLYCPPNAEQRDSPIVWILLVVAFAIAAMGGVVGWVVLRKPKA